jgi:hypothetical protein
MCEKDKPVKFMYLSLFLACSNRIYTVLKYLTLIDKILFCQSEKSKLYRLFPN